MRMKKIIVAILFTILVVCLAGCGKTDTDVAIEDYKWDLTVIQSEKDGAIVGCGSASYEKYKYIEGIKIVDLTLTAQNGSFTICDSTDDKNYDGTYKVSIGKKMSMIYDIVMGKESGHATSAYTEYKYGTDPVRKVPTLIVSIGGFILHFQ